MWNAAPWNDIGLDLTAGLGDDPLAGRSDRAVYDEIRRRLESTGAFGLVELEPDGDGDPPAHIQSYAAIFPESRGRIEPQSTWERRLRVGLYTLEITARGRTPDEALGYADQLSAVATNVLLEDPGYLSWCLPDRTRVTSMGAQEVPGPDCVILLEGEFAYVFRSLDEQG